MTVHSPADNVFRGPRIGAPRRASRALPALACCLLAGLLAIPVAGSDALPGKWVEVRTENFIVVSNAGAKQARHIAEHFERIRAAFVPTFSGLSEFSAPPLRVFATDDLRTIKRLLPRFWESRKRSRPGGVFRHTPTDVSIVVRADLVSGGYLKIVYHEYFHYLAHLTRQPIPVWINEGLADFWGNTRLTRDADEIGHPDLDHLEWLREGFLLPLEELFSVDHSSPHYRRSGKTRQLYAQSWALVHYLLLGDETGERRRQLAECLRLVADGAGSQEAAQKAFGDLDELTSELRRYVRGRLFRYVKQPAKYRGSVDRTAVREVPAGEIAALAARFLLEGRRSRDAEGLVALALEEAPEFPATHEANGLLQVVRRHYPEASAAFQRALEAGAAGPLAHYGSAVLRFHEDRSPESLAAVEASLLEAFRRAPDFAPALARLAEVYRRLDAPERALEAIRQARRVHRSYFRYQLKEAQILLESGARDQALELAGALVDEAVETESSSFNNSICWDGSLWGLAEAVLPACERGVELRPESYAILDSLAVARALTGDFEGARDAFRECLRMAGEGWSESMRSKRTAWIEALERGVAPFTAASLLDDPEESDVGWWL